MKMFFFFTLALISLSVNAFSFRFNFFPMQGIKNFGTYKAFADGALASTCLKYKNPVNSTKYSYSGDTGNGLYKLSSGTIAYCDMTMQNGGWTLVFKDTSNNSSNFTNNRMAQNNIAYGTPAAPMQGISSYKMDSSSIAHTQVLFRSDTGAPIQAYENASAYVIKNAVLSALTGTSDSVCGPFQFDNSGCEMSGMDLDYYSVTNGPITKGTLGNSNSNDGAYWFGDTGPATTTFFTAYSTAYKYLWHSSPPPFSSSVATSGSSPNIIYRAIFLR